MMKRWLCWLLAGLMLCALVGCDRAHDAQPSKDNGTTTTAATTTTTAATTTTTATTAPQENAPLELVEGEAPEGSIRYTDSDAVSTNETLVLKANAPLTELQFLALNPDPPTVDKVLFRHDSLDEGRYWAIHTYINDIVPNRGVACTDKSGKTYYYAITYSGKDGSISLTELNIETLSEERLTEIETMLNAEENNGFVSMNEYTCPEEVSLFDALYSGAGIGVGSWEWSEEEQNDYLVAAEWEEWYISALRFKREDVEALLQKKLGISLADLTKDIDMLYVEKYDAYYHAHSDTQYQPVEVLSGWLEGGEGGLYIIDYKIGWGDGKGRVTLRSTKDGYQFVSNKEIEE